MGRLAESLAPGTRQMPWSTPSTAAAVVAACTEHQGPQRPRGTGGPGLTVLKARDHRDATTAIAMVRVNQVVLINCSAMQPRQAQRLIDMVSGGVLALNGQLRQISPQVVLACSALTSLQHEPAGLSKLSRHQSHQSR